MSRVWRDVLSVEGAMINQIDKDIRDLLAKKHACYVLITCDSPTVEGKMNVEMSYEGDPALASYLLQGALEYIDDHEQECE
jgi:hypothetical protein